MNETIVIKPDNKSIIELYRKILGDSYKDSNDGDILLLANRIKGFCHTIVNSHPKDFSDKSKNNFLSFQSEKNE